MSKQFWSAVHSRNSKQAFYAIVEILKSGRLIGDAAETAISDIADVLSANKVPYTTNVYLSDVDVVDFMIDTVAVKVFLDQSEKSIRGHVKGLCEFDKVSAVIAITDLPFDLPEQIYNRPVVNYLVTNSWFQPAF